jgi:hypothetical protein
MKSKELPANKNKCAGLIKKEAVFKNRLFFFIKRKGRFYRPFIFIEKQS